MADVRDSSRTTQIYRVQYSVQYLEKVKGKSLVNYFPRHGHCGQYCIAC
jgi:hypothetical protein